MSVHCGYLRDLARRLRKTGRMLKCLMKDSNDAKRKAKKNKTVECGGKEKDDGPKDNHDSNSDSESSSSSSSDEE